MKAEIKYTDFPENLTGHIIFFKDPLIVYKHTETPQKDGSIRLGMSNEFKKCQYMRARGGFGSYAVCSGRMIIGDYFESLDDVHKNKIWCGGNTKTFPDGWISELFDETQQEKK